MKSYRVFINDRPAGMYSAYKQVSAGSPEEAIRKFEKPPLLPKVHAVEWPARSAADRQWVETYVGGSL